VLEEVVDGLGSAPQAFLDVLAGRNVGKRMVRVERA
jgi:NADPH-dependent curcumin reductase CurA